jgi:hypothetical protein
MESVCCAGCNGLALKNSSFVYRLVYGHSYVRISYAQKQFRKYRHNRNGSETKHTGAPSSAGRATSQEFLQKERTIGTLQTVFVLVSRFLLIPTVVYTELLSRRYYKRKPPIPIHEVNRFPFLSAVAVHNRFIRKGFLERTTIDRYQYTNGGWPWKFLKL